MLSGRGFELYLERIVPGQSERKIPPAPLEAFRLISGGFLFPIYSTLASFCTFEMC